MRVKWRYGDKNAAERPCGVGNVLCLDCIDADILVVTLCYSFARYYHWGKLGNKSVGILCIIFTQVRFLLKEREVTKHLGSQICYKVVALSIAFLHRKIGLRICISLNNFSVDYLKLIQQLYIEHLLCTRNYRM